MRLDRKKNAVRGMVAGTINKIVVMFLPFVMRTIILYYLGTQYLGLSSLFTSVISLFCLTELGIGGAMVYSMYKPIAEDDVNTICALLNLYKKLYRIIGSIICGIGILFLPFLSNVITGDIPSELNIYVLYLIYLSNSVLTYFLFSYKNSLLDAFQRKDIDLNVNSILTFSEYTIQIILVLLTRNYYAYVVIFPIFTVLGNLIRAYIVSKKYPQYICRGEISKAQQKSIFSKIGALSFHKIGYVVSLSVSNIIVSALCGLTAVAIYGNYNYVITSILSIANIIFVSFTPGIANKMLLESKENNEITFYNLLFVNMWFTIWFCTCMVVLCQHFMRLWVGENLLLPTFTIFLFAFSLYLQMMRKVVCIYNDAAGIWKEDKFKPIFGAIFNIAVSIIFTKLYGLIGVVIGFSLSFLLIEIPWETYVLYKYYFQKSVFCYLKKMLPYTSALIVSVVICYWLCSFLSNEGYWTFVGKILIVLILPNILLLICFHKKKEYAYFYGILLKKRSQRNI